MIVFDANDQRAAHGGFRQRGRAGHRCGEGDSFRHRCRYREKRAAADSGVERDAVIEHAREPLDDRQSEPQAASDPGALFEPVKLLEDFTALEKRNADAGIVDADLQCGAVTAAAHQHAAVRRVFDGVGDQILQQPPQHQPIGFHRQRRRHEGQFQPLGARHRRELDFQRTHQVADAETGDRGLHGAGVEPGNIQQRAEDFLDGFQGVVDVFDQPRILAAVLAFHQARHIQPRRVERLQNIVACGRQKAGLGNAGVFRGAFGQRQFGVQPRQFLGAIAHALFQRRIGALQRLGGLEARRHIGERDNQPAAWHAVGPHFDHHMAVRKPLEIGLALGGVGGQALIDRGVVVAEAGGADRAEEFQDFPKRNSDLHQMRRQAENLAELPVRTDQLQIRIEHRDALPHMIERGLQHLAVEMQRGVRIIQQFQRRSGGNGALAQQQRHHQPRRRRPDRGRDQVLGVLQQFEVRGRRRFKADAVAGGEGLEGFACAVGAEILRDGGEDILHRHRAAPAPECRRHRREFVRNENPGLQPFDRGGLAQQRQHDVGQDVERQAPQHAMHQRRQIGAEQGLRTQRFDAERTVLKQQQAGGVGIHEAWKKQRVEPHREADQHAADGAACGCAPPDQPAEKRRRELRDGGERQQADRGQLGIAQRAIVKIRHHHDGENREAPHPEQEVAEILAAGARFRTALQHQRHHDVVGDHDRQRDAFHDHHGGRRRQAADEDADAEQRRLALDRQRQDVHIAIDGTERKGHEAGKRDRDHEQIDGDQI